ncbi:MAG: hypothetical protein WDN03_05820 [Rhizomicrobium sp.]
MGRPSLAGGRADRGRQCRARRPVDGAAYRVPGDRRLCDLQYYGRDNVAVDQIGNPLPMFGRYTTAPAKIIQMPAPPTWPEGLKPMPSGAVQQYVLHNAGARPWDRDYDDVRLIADVAEGRGIIINSEADIHGYPVQKPTARPVQPRRLEPVRHDAEDAGGARLVGPRPRNVTLSFPLAGGGQRAPHHPSPGRVPLSPMAS